MIKLYDQGVFVSNGLEILADGKDAAAAKRGTMAYSILTAHNTSGNDEKLRIKFDALTSHDITYVGIIQTARASGLTKFPIPYVLTNCHNSLCAVGGTINEDDHLFGLSAAKKYGGNYVPAHQAVIHQYMREMMAGCGKMILGSDSHTRYGALGTMAIGEGGPELVKQLLSRTYDVDMPKVAGIYLEGTPAPGVGPQDVALAIIGAVFANGFVKNKVMEFIGPGIAGLSMDFRNGIDVMTTETTCLTSIWMTDSKTEEFLSMHGRANDYKKLAPAEIAYYDCLVKVDLGKIKPMIALPFHPSNAYTIEDFNRNAGDILRGVEKYAADSLGKKDFVLTNKLENGKLRIDQGVIAGCAGGTFENLVAAASILNGSSIGNGDFALSVYPSSQPVFLELMRNGSLSSLVGAGATIRTAFCGPCFGAGDVPANNALSIRHSTRNFPNREGSKPGDGQIASVALMDARSIAATAANKGLLTPATDIDFKTPEVKYNFDGNVYQNRCYFGFGKADDSVPLRFGPNIADWPEMSPLTENLLLKVVCKINDPVTTTDELIPSGETSSYRSNPLKLAEFTLSRKAPDYVGKAKEVQGAEKARLAGSDPLPLAAGLADAFKTAQTIKADLSALDTGIGSTIFAIKPGDGSAREQAASCQKVLGGWANIANEYATKRYRSNLINWGMLPFIIDGDPAFEDGDFLFITDIRSAVAEKREEISAYILRDGKALPFTMKLAGLTDDERKIILAGCLINFYKEQNN